MTALPDPARLLDQVWYVEADDQTRTERLIRRHVSYGKTAGRRPGLGGTLRRGQRPARRRHPRPSRSDRADLIVTASAERTA
jgi:hypothetical protein